MGNTLKHGWWKVSIHPKFDELRAYLCCPALGEFNVISELIHFGFARLETNQCENISGFQAPSKWLGVCLQVVLLTRETSDIPLINETTGNRG